MQPTFDQSYYKHLRKMQQHLERNPGTLVRHLPTGAVFPARLRGVYAILTRDDQSKVRVFLDDIELVSPLEALATVNEDAAEIDSGYDGLEDW